MFKNILSKIKHPPHQEHIHKTTKTEFILAIIIALLLTGTLVSKQYLEPPFYIIPLLIAVFIGLKVKHIIKSGGTILEDYASIGVISLFLLLYLILKGDINATLTVIVIFILFYSAGLMLWVRSTFGSRKITHFLISYAITVVMIIFLFAGSYYSQGEKFIVQGTQAPIPFEDALYFSTITFTTVGFGDIIPLGINKFLAAFEAFLGLMVNIALMGFILSNNKIPEGY
ncbi:MAG TPA: ion channel [Candidatus Nanoarchaeia archaeon]|nr:ion channel [Candidatus Nanoarchaeia archaeon]